MAKCEICAKETRFGNARSHAMNATKRSWKPNVRRVRIIENGTPKTIKICSRCLRSNKVTRAI
ncbi:MAG TPA: 50S ribosomal protein L28 [Clostridiaceae bacterium]|nr:50S ribosomal protein L28 [Clostridiaceae bacterium]